jgi:hypothetical protein
VLETEHAGGVAGKAVQPNPGQNHTTDDHKDQADDASNYLGGAKYPPINGAMALMDFVMFMVSHQ